MDAVHLHLLLNHFPIIGTLIGVIVLLVGVILRKQQVSLTAYIILAGMAIAAIPVMLTGEPAEDAVEKLAGVSENLIENHEHAAELAFWIMEALGIFSLIAFFTTILNYSIAPMIKWLTLILGFVAFGAMARTGYLGGQIRHSEIRTGGANTAAVSDQAGGNETGEDED